MWSRQVVQAVPRGGRPRSPRPTSMDLRPMESGVVQVVVQARSILWSRRDASGGAGWSRRSTLSPTFTHIEEKRKRVANCLDHLDRPDRAEIHHDEQASGSCVPTQRTPRACAGAPSMAARRRGSVLAVWPSARVRRPVRRRTSGSERRTRALEPGTRVRALQPDSGRQARCRDHQRAARCSTFDAASRCSARWCWPRPVVGGRSFFADRCNPRLRLQYASLPPKRENS